MKTTERFVDEILEKTKKTRRKKRIKWSLIACFSVALLTFLVGFSNIVTFDVFSYSTAYRSYLDPYLCEEDGETVGLKLINDTSAVVSVGEKAYPCVVKAESKSRFVLMDNSEGIRESEEEESNEQPSVFYVDFWEDKATLSWSAFGVEMKKILSITDECGVPAGVWRLFATKSWTDEELVYKDEGAGWTIILDNGDSYTGEGMDSAWVTKFVSINDQLFQCMFDVKSGVILDASAFVYDTTSFEYPVIIERYLSDGDEHPHYFYSRQMTDEDKTDFTGGSFTAGAVLYQSAVEELPKSPFSEAVSKWRLVHKKEQEQQVLDLSAKLDLNEDGSALLTVKGDRDYKGKTKGKWYALQHSVLVVLDKSAPLTGKTFTVYVSGATSSETTADYKEKAMTRLELYSYYKLGYHAFDYYGFYEDFQIFWGEKYADGVVIPKLVYDTPYVLNATYFQAYYDDKNFDPDDYDDEDGYYDYFVPFPQNGKVVLEFKKNASVFVTYANGVTVERVYLLWGNGTMIEIVGGIYLTSKLQDGVRENFSFRYLDVTLDGLEQESGYHHVLFELSDG